MPFNVIFDNGLPIKDFIGISEYYLEDIAGEIIISFKISSKNVKEEKLVKDIKEGKSFKIDVFKEDVLSIWLCVEENYYVVIGDIENKYTDFFEKGLVKLNIMMDEDLSAIIEVN